MDLKYVTGPITKATAGGLEAVISTPKVDSDGESVDPMGLTNRDEWLSNPLIYWAHEWAYDHAAEPIGKGTTLAVTKAQITSAAEYAPTPKAQNVRALVQGGFVRKTSIGFDPITMAEIKGVPTHTKWALREWSIVPMPANSDATITGTKAALQWFADQFEVEEEVAPDSLGAAAAIRDKDLSIHIPVTVRTITQLIARADYDHLRFSAIPGGDDGALVLVNDGPRVIAGIRRRRVLTLP